MQRRVMDLVTQYLRSEFGRVPAPDEPLLGAGLLDSLRFVLFIAHVEEQLGRRIPEEDLTEDNFRDVASTVAYLDSISELEAGASPAAM
jgi:acyl carrier protein